MRTAYCFTPDRTFFPPAVRAIASLIAAEPDGAQEIVLICEPDDVSPGFDRLAPALRGRIELMTLDFSRYDKSLSAKGRFSRAVFRRLFLDDILPSHFERIVTVDSDMLIVRPGLKRLETLDLGGRPLAAAYDMIFLMDFKGGALARQFQRSRRSLGLKLDDALFQRRADGDRPRRVAGGEIDRARDRGASPDARAFPVQRAGRAERDPQGRLRAPVAALQFHGRLFPSRSRDAGSSRSSCISSTRRNPGNTPAGRAKARFAEAYRAWFAASPWPEWAKAPEKPPWRRTRPPLTRLRRSFAERLAAFLDEAPFVDRRASGSA